VQPPRDRRADALRAAGDQNDLPAEACLGHASRLPLARRAGCRWSSWNKGATVPGSSPTAVIPLQILLDARTISPARPAMSAPGRPKREPLARSDKVVQ
jgi:hypothetical protein